MNDLRKAAEMALEALENMNPYPASKEDLRNDAITALRQALDHVPDTMKMTEPEELVCVCGAIWQGQEMICPPRCLEEGIEREMPTDRGAWSDVPDATKWVGELRGDEDSEQEPVELKHLRDVHDAQGSDGAWNSNQYMCGLFNGLELALSIFESREPVYKELSQPEQEPVAYFWRDTKLCYWIGHGSPKIDFQDLANLDVKPLYTAPPSKPWVALTDEEMKQTCYEAWSFDPYVIAQAIQEKLRSKNEH